MKVSLTEDCLLVGNRKCKTVTITEQVDGSFKFVLMHIEGYTTYENVECKHGWNVGKTITKMKKLHLSLKSKSFDYSGIALVERYWHNSDYSYKSATAKNGNYVNFYYIKNKSVSS